jgi:hypothetical protein
MDTQMDTVDRVGDTLVLMTPDGEVLDTHRTGERHGDRREAKRVVLGWIARHTVCYADAMRLI